MHENEPDNQLTSICMTVFHGWLRSEERWDRAMRVSIEALLYGVALLLVLPW